MENQPGLEAHGAETDHYRWGQGLSGRWRILAQYHEVLVDRCWYEVTSPTSRPRPIRLVNQGGLEPGKLISESLVLVLVPATKHSAVYFSVLL